MYYICMSTPIIFCFIGFVLDIALENDDNNRKRQNGRRGTVEDSYKDSALIRVFFGTDGSAVGTRKEHFQ